MPGRAQPFGSRDHPRAEPQMEWNRTTSAIETPPNKTTSQATPALPEAGPESTGSLPPKKKQTAPFSPPLLFPQKGAATTTPGGEEKGGPPFGPPPGARC